MPGQLGNVKVTVQSLEIVRIDPERQLILVKGAVPGADGRDVIVNPAIKPAKVKATPAAKGDGKKPAAKK